MAKRERMVIFYGWNNRVTVNERQYDNISLPSRKRIKRVCGAMAVEDSFFQGGCAWRIPSSAAEPRCICTQLTALEPTVNPDCPAHGALYGK